MTFRPLSLMARNNAWANETLLAACAGLAPGEWDARRTAFFPSLRATLEHLHAVDLYYIDAVEGGGRGLGVYDPHPSFADVPSLAAAQRLSDIRLIRLAEQVDPMQPVDTDRGAQGMVTETAGAVLLHLFQHQIHHRGQAHAMLSGSSVPPPQLDDFHLAFGRVPAAGAWLEPSS
ncbi:MAG: DinB family protein [Paracoccaceae bacterium]|nr:MAG: DinB family protein [Paracoccaceae bacterium]